MNRIVELRDLTVAYGRVVAVDRVSLSVPAGCITAIVGPNGAGKTSLVNALMGLIPSTGGIRFPFAPAAARSVEARVRAGITLVSEKRDLFGPMSVIDHLRLGAYVHRHDRGVDTRARLKEVFALFPRLEERRDQPAQTLSGGERQMVALGRALMLRPRLLLLDEPSLGLAPLVVAEIFRIIEGLRADGISVLLIEQNARAALAVADEAHVLENGVVQISGPAREVAADPRVVQSYLGMAGAAAPEAGTAPSIDQEIRPCRA